MLGAIAGDIIGSVYEGKVAWQSARTPHFKPLFHPKARFTDDTVLTIAVAESILHGGDLVDLFKDYARSLPGRRVRRDVSPLGRVGEPRAVPELGQRLGDAREPRRLRL